MGKRSFKETTKGMTFVEKAEYLWEYYRWVLLVVFFGAIVLSMVLTGVINAQKEPVFGAIAVNMPLTEEGNAFLTDGWVEFIGAEKGATVELFSTSFQDLDATSDPEIALATAYRVVLMIAAEDCDYLLMDETALSYYKNHPVFTALDEMISEELLEQYADRIIWQETEEGESIPVVLDITESAFAQNYMTKDTKVYIGFPGNTGRTEQNEIFLRYILG